MRFRELSVVGAWQIDTDVLDDSRGFFCRAWCAAEFAEHGLPGNISQATSARRPTASTRW
jgi:dTDP-4-dehydrorhamnose 3,5-epimerase